MKRRVAVLQRAFDPVQASDVRVYFYWVCVCDGGHPWHRVRHFMSHFAQLAAELCNCGAVYGVVLAPLGCDYYSADTRLGGLTALARFVCCAVAVESVLPALRQVVCVDVALHDQTTYAMCCAAVRMIVCGSGIAVRVCYAQLCHNSGAARLGTPTQCGARLGARGRAHRMAGAAGGLCAVRQLPNQPRRVCAACCGPRRLRARAAGSPVTASPLRAVRRRRRTGPFPRHGVVHRRRKS